MATADTVFDASVTWVPDALMGVYANSTPLATSLVHQYNMIMEKRDPRADSLPLMSSPLPTLFMCSAYLGIVYLGPRVMANRKAMELTNVMIGYNLFQALFNFWIFSRAVPYWFGGQYNWICQAVDYSSHPDAINMLWISWWYYISKFVDFFDTFVFVMRKKDSQMTFLHIIHHFSLPLFAWFGPRFAGGGNTSFGGMWNLFIHVVMYTYYLLSSLGERVKPYLWWKKYLTALQMAQFLLVFCHSLIPFVHPTCGFPIGMSSILLFNGMLYWILFWNFYKKSYTVVRDRNFNTTSKPASKKM